MQIYTIYIARNKVDNKIYVGFDSNYPHRKSAHKHAAKKNADLPLERAIRKYGFDAFEWEVIYQSWDRDHTQNVMESFFIDQYNSFAHKGHGYNLTKGGEGTFGWIPSEDTRRRISEANLGKEAWNKGKPSPWTSERNKANKGCKVPARQKEYIVTDPSGNKYEVKGLVDFCKKQNLHKGNMSSVASGKLNHYKGWKCQPK